MKSIIAVVVALVVVGAGWYWYANYYVSPQPLPSSNTTTNNTNNTTDTGVNADINAGVTSDQFPMSATITLTATGFSPSSVTVKKGGAVNFVDQTASPMWVASAPHPTHEGYSGTTRSQHCPDTAGVAFDQCAPGTNYSFVFQKVGSWQYHNHTNTSEFGTVNVVE